ISPNRPHAEFTADLDLLGQAIDRKACQRKIIATEDFNASAHEWGAIQTDVRGRELNEWLAERDMVVINEGTTPTFQRRASQAEFIDVSPATAGVAQRIQKWRVQENIESLSDHRYISFYVTFPAIRGASIGEALGKQPSWRKLNEEILITKDCVGNGESTQM
ncbi:Pol protein-like, partial [Tropilaelaps mercedesae]